MGLTPHRPRSDPEGTGAACPWQRDANNSGAARDNGGTLPGRTNAVFNTELEQLALLLGKGCSASPGNGGQQQQHPHPLPQPEPTSGQCAPGCSGMSRDEPGRAGMSRDAACTPARTPCQACGLGASLAWSHGCVSPGFSECPPPEVVGSSSLAQSRSGIPAESRGTQGSSGLAQPREGFAFISLTFLAGQ